MPHDHHHHHIDPDAGDARMAWAVVVNMVLTLAQVVGGLLSGSLALTAALTYSMSKHSMNIRAAFLHNLADALGSVAVILAGTCVIVWGWTWVDPVVTLLIAGYILWHVKAEAGGVIRVLMLGSPPDMEMSEVIAAMRAVPGVKDLHHLHLWQMEEHRAALQAHVVIDESDNGRQQQIGARIKQTLRDRFGIGHTTLDIELNSATCTNTRLIGH